MSLGEAVLFMKVGLLAGTINTAARARPATRKQTLVELRKLCDLTRNLHNHISTVMHSPALRLIEAELKKENAQQDSTGNHSLAQPLLLDVQLKGMFEAARKAWTLARDGGELPQPTNRGTKPGAKDVTRVAMRVFEQVTGESAGRQYSEADAKEGGATLAFLTAIFDALAVRAKPAGQLRLWKKHG